jgi:methionine sulfoxide reductase heme-binding subunit
MIMWITLRAAGIGAFVMLFLAVCWGIIGTTSLFGKRISKQNAILVHQFMSTVGLVLMATHILLLLVDSFMPFHLRDVFIPMTSSFRPVAITFGVLAMYTTAVLLSSSWTRKYYSTALWRRIHLLAVPAFALAMAHGIFAGTDTQRPWMWATYIGSGLIVVFLVMVRALTYGYRPPRAEPPTHARTGGRAKVDDRPSSPRPRAAPEPASEATPEPESAAAAAAAAERKPPGRPDLAPVTAGRPPGAAALKRLPLSPTPREAARARGNGHRP